MAVFWGIVEYKMWGFDTLEHRPAMMRWLVVGVMFAYLAMEMLLHMLASAVGEVGTISAVLALVAAVLLGLLFERPSHLVKQAGRQVLFAAKGQEPASLNDFLDEVAECRSGQDVANVLGTYLQRSVGIDALRLAIRPRFAAPTSFDWPTDGQLPTELVPLTRSGVDLGDLLVHLPDRQELGAVERQLVSEFGTQALLVIVLLAQGGPLGSTPAGPATTAPALPVREQDRRAPHRVRSSRRQDGRFRH